MKLSSILFGFSWFFIGLSSSFGAGEIPCKYSSSLNELKRDIDDKKSVLDEAYMETVKFTESDAHREKPYLQFHPFGMHPTLINSFKNYLLANGLTLKDIRSLDVGSFVSIMNKNLKNDLPELADSFLQAVNTSANNIQQLSKELQRFGLDLDLIISKIEIAKKKESLDSEIPEWLEIQIFVGEYFMRQPDKLLEDIKIYSKQTFWQKFSSFFSSIEFEKTDLADHGGVRQEVKDSIDIISKIPYLDDRASAFESFIRKNGLSVDELIIILKRIPYNDTKAEAATYMVERYIESLTTDELILIVKKIPYNDARSSNIRYFAKVKKRSLDANDFSKLIAAAPYLEDKSYLGRLIIGD